MAAGGADAEIVSGALDGAVEVVLSAWFKEYSAPVRASSKITRPA